MNQSPLLTMIYLLCTHQQKKWPLPQSTVIGSVSPKELASTETFSEGSMLDGSLTARPHPGDGHHFKVGLLSTKAWKIFVGR